MGAPVPATRPDQAAKALASSPFTGAPQPPSAAFVEAARELPEEGHRFWEGGGHVRRPGVGPIGVRLSAAGGSAA